MMRVVIVSHFSELRQQTLPICLHQPKGLSELISIMNISDGDLGASNIDVRLQMKPEIEFWALSKNFHKSRFVVHGSGRDDRNGGGQCRDGSDN